MALNWRTAEHPTSSSSRDPGHVATGHSATTGSCRRSDGEDMVANREIAAVRDTDSAAQYVNENQELATGRGMGCVAPQLKRKKQQRGSGRVAKREEGADERHMRWEEKEERAEEQMEADLGSETEMQTASSRISTVLPVGIVSPAALLHSYEELGTQTEEMGLSMQQDQQMAQQLRTELHHRNRELTAEFGSARDARQQRTQEEQELAVITAALQQQTHDARQQRTQEEQEVAVITAALQQQTQRDFQREHVVAHLEAIMVELASSQVQQTETHQSSLEQCALQHTEAQQLLRQEHQAIRAHQQELDMQARREAQQRWQNAENRYETLAEHQQELRQEQQIIIARQQEVLVSEEIQDVQRHLRQEQQIIIACQRDEVARRLRREAHTQEIAEVQQDLRHEQQIILARQRDESMTRQRQETQLRTLNEELATAEAVANQAPVAAMADLRRRFSVKKVMIYLRRVLDKRAGEQRHTAADDEVDRILRELESS